jgi:chromosome segregation ATPase
MEDTRDESEFATFEDDTFEEPEFATFEDNTFEEPKYATFEEECLKTHDEWEKIYLDRETQFDKETEAFKLKISILERQNKKKEEENEELENLANKLDARNRKLDAENCELKAKIRKYQQQWCGRDFPPFL